MQQQIKKILIIIGLFIFCTGISAFGATQEQTIKFAGQWPFHPSKAIALDNSRGYIYVGNGDHLLVLKASDLSMLADYPVTASGQITCVKYDSARQLLFVTCKNNGMQILNVQNPASPQLAGAYIPTDSTGDINSVAIDGNQAYIACHLLLNDQSNVVDVRVLNIATSNDIVAPPVLQSISLQGAFGITYAIDIAVSNGYAYAADLYTGIHFIKLPDPSTWGSGGQATPNHIVVLAGAHDLDVAGGYLYSTSEASGVSITDVTDPAKPNPVALYKVSGQNQAVIPVEAVRVYQDRAYLAAGNGLHVIDVSDQSNPKAFSPPEYYATNTTVYSLALSADATNAYITDYGTGLEKLDLSNLTSIQRTASFALPAGANSIDLAGGYAYVVDNTVGTSSSDEGLRIFQYTVTNGVVQLQRVGFLATPGEASDVYVDQNAGYVYVADGDNGLQIINASDPTSPSLAGSVSTGGFAGKVTVSTTNSDYAYVADHSAGLVIVNISKPDSPTVVSSVAMPDSGTANAVAIGAAGDYAYVAAGSAGLQVVDISNPTAPKLLTLSQPVDTGGNAAGISIDPDSGLAYIADKTNGLIICDISSISSSSHPVTVEGSVATGGEAQSVLVASATYAYVSAGLKGIVAVNISDPTDPVVDTSWSYDTAGICVDAKGFTNNSTGEFYLLAADSGDGVVALNPTVTTTTESAASSSGSGGCFISAMRR